jgi:hypothetical protein
MRRDRRGFVWALLGVAVVPVMPLVRARVQQVQQAPPDLEPPRAQPSWQSLPEQQMQQAPPDLEPPRAGTLGQGQTGQSTPDQGGTAGQGRPDREPPRAAPDGSGR